MENFWHISTIKNGSNTPVRPSKWPVENNCGNLCQCTVASTDHYWHSNWHPHNIIFTNDTNNIFKFLSLLNHNHLKMVCMVASKTVVHIGFYHGPVQWNTIESFVQYGFRGSSECLSISGVCCTWGHGGVAISCFDGFQHHCENCDGKEKGEQFIICR